MLVFLPFLFLPSFVLDSLSIHLMPFTFSPFVPLLPHPLTVPPVLGGFFFLHLHLAFSALLCPTPGESTSFQTQSYFSNTSRSLESSVRPHTLCCLPLCVCVCVSGLAFMCTFSDVLKLTGRTVSSVLSFVLSSLLSFFLSFFLAFFRFGAKLQVNY